MLPRSAHNRLLAIALALLVLAAAPAQAQGLGLGLDLGDLGVDLDVGGGNGIDLDVDLGGSGGGGVGLDLGLGGDDVLDLELGGTGSPAGSGGGDALDAALGGTLTLSQDAALLAVRNHRALPLDEVMLRAQLIADGEIIDAQLIAVQDVLLYEFKVLSRAGAVSDLYFYAQSGMPVE